MALDNYANLKAAVMNWSHRQDVGSFVDDFITLAENEFYHNANSPLRVRYMEALDTGACSTSDRFLALPTDYLEQRRLDITLNTERKPIKFVTPNQMNIETLGGNPTYFTVTTRIEFNRQPDQAYVTNLQYYKKLTALDSTNTTNDILTYYPNIYLYGSLWALFQWARNDEEEAKFYNKFMNAIEGANDSSERGRYGASPSMRLRRPFA